MAHIWRRRDPRLVEVAAALSTTVELQATALGGDIHRRSDTQLVVHELL